VKKLREEEESGVRAAKQIRNSDLFADMGKLKCSQLLKIAKWSLSLVTYAHKAQNGVSL